ncbi:MAG TPA: hypothetical protein VLW51_04475 [Solirubrobacteraceae bacterium]|nr:hypothetical protein [Solirubrobacteraceae bacterium]
MTEALRARGELIHPASAHPANESAHIPSAAVGEHELNVFDAFRRVDEILAANLMVFHDLVRDEQYGLWTGDEARELDHYVHESPELKTAAYAWITDLAGWLPMGEGGEHEACLTADYNAEMIEQVARYPRVRDRAIFVGDREDVVPDRFGDELPLIPEWIEEHFTFAGYITGFDRAEFSDRDALGYRSDERVCLVTVGGPGVGADLLRRVIDSFTGANRRPFLYFPLKHHFEQNVHVRHRLERYGAGRRTGFDAEPPDAIAEAIASEIGREVGYRPVTAGGAARAAAGIAELLG